ncbi:MAG: HAD hydrolase-like protein [Anaerolineaceae bacterium]|nr:HAD hydrolase-like protein [Anaerolineaceae bacterium]
MPQITNPQDIQLILWDIDGTLIMPKGVGRAATRLAMLEIFNTDAGLETHYFGGKTDWQTLLDLLPSQGFTEDAIQELLPAYAQSVARHMGRIIVDYSVEQCPGAHGLVAELHRLGHPLQGLVTGNTETIAPIKLRAGGFDPDWFVIGAYGNESPNRNDLPPLAVSRAEKLIGRKIAPENVVIIGDTPADIACARALGAVAVGVRTGYATSPTELVDAKPDYLLNDLTTFWKDVLPIFT